MKKVIVNAQWQGGEDIATFDGAQELINLYLEGEDYIELPVSTDVKEMSVKKNGIKGYEILRKQMQSAYACIAEGAPDRILTLGGGCDADVPTVVYLNERYKGDLTVLWLDAHGDLNSPSESSSSLFYGMPLRSLMDDNCFGLLDNRFPLKASNVVHIGGRDFDDAEKKFIKDSGISAYTARDIHADHGLLRRIAENIQTSNIYIHLDLDVTDPDEFADTPLPVGGGLSCEEVYSILEAASDKMIGLGIYEHIPCREMNAYIEKLIKYGLAL